MPLSTTGLRRRKVLEQRESNNKNDVQNDNDSNNKVKKHRNSWISSFKWSSSNKEKNDNDNKFQQHPPRRIETPLYEDTGDDDDDDDDDNNKASNDHEQEDHENSSCSKSSNGSSLLSDRESLDGSDYEYKYKERPKERIRRKFVLRDRILKRIGKVKGITFANMLRQNEVAVRNLERMKHLNSISRSQQHHHHHHHGTITESEVEYMLPHPPPLVDLIGGGGGGGGVVVDDKDGTPKMSNESINNNSKAPEEEDKSITNRSNKHFFLSRRTWIVPPPPPHDSGLAAPPLGGGGSGNSSLNGFLVMEWYQGLPSGLLIIVYCLSAYVFCIVIDQTLNMMAAACISYISILTFDILTVILAYFIMRMTGYIWIFVDNDSYLSVKFDMHNRQKLGYWDAKLLAFFNNHSRLASFLNLCSFYAIYDVVVNYFDIGCRDFIFIPTKEWYATIVQEANNELLAIHASSSSSSDQITILDDLSECEIIQTYIQETWRRGIGGYLCRSELNESLIMFPVQIVFCVLFAQLQGYLGNDFISSIE